MLDLVFTTKLSLIKPSTSIPGISDHAMAVTSIKILPRLIRKCYMFSKANWETIYSDDKKVSEKVTSLPLATGVDKL